MRKGQKAWDYNHTEHAWPVCHVFMPANKDFNRWPLLKQKLNLIQQVESNNHLRGGVVNLYNTMETSWIVAMHKMGYRYACIWFDGAWADTHDFNNALLTELDRLNTNEWLAAGQIQAREDEYPFFTRNIILLNIEKWMELDQPNPHIRPPEFPDYVVVDGFEDSAYSITEVPQEFTERDLEWMIFNKSSHFGNAWIPWALRRHLAVYGISDDFANTITYTRPLNGTDEFQNGISGKEYDTEPLSHKAKQLCSKLESISTPIYFVNTENSKPEIVNELQNTGFEQYVGPCAGFKLLYYAYKYGFNQDTKFVFYDFDKDSVDFKLDTLMNWDGQDYVSWVNAWCESNPGKNTDLLPLVAERWPQVVDQFGGKGNWKDFYSRFKQCKSQVVYVDLVNDSENLLSLLNKRKTFFWSSNIYSYMPIKLASNPFEIERSFINVIQTLNDMHEDSWFCGTDINDNDLMCPSRAILTVGENNNIGFEV